jgi:hypothetical protein
MRQYLSPWIEHQAAFEHFTRDPMTIERSATALTMERARNCGLQPAVIDLINWVRWDGRMDISGATESDIVEAARCLAASFAADPLIPFFFPGDDWTCKQAATEFFSLLITARVALGMPVILLRHEGAIAGAVMGYDTRRPTWPDDLQARLSLLEQSNPQTARRFEIYEAASERHKPQLSHYYLGVIGISPSRQGTGSGGVLLRAFCERSDGDPDSTGTYLETGNPANVTFYEHFGFEKTGEAQLDSATHLFCFYRPRAGANA